MHDTLLDSPLALHLAQADAATTHNGYQLSHALELPLPAELTLRDCTHVARIGLKGRGSAVWLARQGVAVPAAPNRAARDASGCIVARLGNEDFLLIGTLDAHSEHPARLMTSWQKEHDAGARNIGFPTPKQYSHALLHLAGERAPDLLAALCAVDLRPGYFAYDALAQTISAGIVATFLRHDLDGRTGYLMLVDTSLALYFWESVVDAAQGLGSG